MNEVMAIYELSVEEKRLVMLKYANASNPYIKSCLKSCRPLCIVVGGYGKFTSGEVVIFWRSIFDNIIDLLVTFKV